MFGTALPEEVEVVLTQYTSLADRTVPETATARRNLKLAEHGQRLAGLSVRARLWYTLAIIFPSLPYMHVHYGQAKRIWWPLFYVIRWAEILRLVVQR